MLGHAVLDERIGGPVETPRCRMTHRLKQLVDRNAQSKGELMKRAGMRMRDATSQAAERSLIERGGRHHLLERQVVPGHNATQIPGHSRCVAVDSGCWGQRMGSTISINSHRRDCYVQT